MQKKLIIPLCLLTLFMGLLAVSNNVDAKPKTKTYNVTVIYIDKINHKKISPNFKRKVKAKTKYRAKRKNIKGYIRPAQITKKITKKTTIIYRYRPKQYAVKTKHLHAQKGIAVAKTDIAKVNYGRSYTSPTRKIVGHHAPKPRRLVIKKATNITYSYQPQTYQITIRYVDKNGKSIKANDFFNAQYGEKINVPAQGINGYHTPTSRSFVVKGATVVTYTYLLIDKPTISKPPTIPQNPLIPEPVPEPTPDPELDPDPLNPTPAPEEEPGTDPTPNPEEEPGTEPTPDPEEEPSTNPTPAPEEEPGTDPEPAPEEEPGTDPTPNPEEEPGTEPTPDPEEEPSTNPTPDPEEEPGTDPEPNPEEEPGTDPTPDPEEDPSTDPTPDPEEEPSTEPTPDPEEEPSTDPTPDPEEEPSTDPTPDPEEEPSTDPTPNPEEEPGTDPTPDPEEEPGTDPEEESSTNPTPDPEEEPSTDPTPDPEEEPSTDPTPDPEEEPSTDPTPDPEEEPSTDPTPDPEEEPSTDPTPDPEEEPSTDPTPNPEEEPGTDPTPDPEEEPSTDPTPDPEEDPTPEPEEPQETLAQNPTIDTADAMKALNDSPIQTADQLRTQIQKMNTEGFAIDEASIMGLHATWAGMNLLELEKMVKEEPIVQNYLKGGGKIILAADQSLFSSKSTVGMASLPSHQIGDKKVPITIYLNPEAFNTSNLESDMRQYAYNSDSKSSYHYEDGVALYTAFHVPVKGSKLPVYTITHEFGHLIQYIYMVGTSNYDMDTPILAIQNQYIAETGNTLDDFVNGVSAYAYVAPPEMWAELYTSYRLGVPTPQNKYVAPTIASWNEKAFGK